MQRWIQRWKSYRYRFVPWLLLNFKNRSLRSVTEDGTDLVLSEAIFLQRLHSFLTAVHKNFSSQEVTCEKGQEQMTPENSHIQSLAVMKEIMGFTVERAPSVLPSGGTGVKVTSGTVQPGQVTSLYPGLIYEPHEPIFFQSIGNPFIFRCADRVLLDGNDHGLSRSLYKSCRGRDSCWPLASCDMSWLTPFPVCPLNVGQYVNNQSKRYPANVAYQEFNVPEAFPARLRQYLPNIHYSPSIHKTDDSTRLLRLVALVALREIQCGEELFSSYFTIIS